MIAGWHVVAYTVRVCWIALAKRTPFRPGVYLLGPEGGRFAFGQSREEAIANLREACAE